MEFQLLSLDGDPITADFAQVGSVYTSDDVIYIEGVPCRLSSARPHLPAITEKLDLLGIWASNPDILARIVFALELLDKIAAANANANIALGEIRYYARADKYICDCVAYGLGCAPRPKSPTSDPAA